MDRVNEKHFISKTYTLYILRNLNFYGNIRISTYAMVSWTLQEGRGLSLCTYGNISSSDRELNEAYAENCNMNEYLYCLDDLSWSWTWGGNSSLNM